MGSFALGPRTMQIIEEKNVERHEIDESPNPSGPSISEKAERSIGGCKNVLPAPASLVAGSLKRLGRERVRAVLNRNGSWTFNYSTIKLDEPDLAQELDTLIPALETAVSPLRMLGFELTFGRPLDMDEPSTNAVTAFMTFAQTVTGLIERVAPQEPTRVSVCWGEGGYIGDCLNDWRLDLRPIEEDVRKACKQLIQDLNVWLSGIMRVVIQLEHCGVHDDPV